MDWKQIEKDYNEWLFNGDCKSLSTTDWFKERIEAELSKESAPPLSEEEKNEFHTTNVTAEVKAKYV